MDRKTLERGCTVCGSVLIRLTMDDGPRYPYPMSADYECGCFTCVQSEGLCDASCPNALEVVQKLRADNAQLLSQNVSYETKSGNYDDMQSELEKLKQDSDMSDGCLGLVKQALINVGVDMSKTPAMFYEEAIYNAVGTREKTITDLQDKLDRAQTYIESLQRVIPAELQGIDKTEVDHKDGWWETSTGAEFGQQVLANIQRALDVDLKGEKE